jgi:transcriptional regulator with XRE-family HTH domain
MTFGTSEQVAFGAELRQQRERRKISLATVAESTKIKQSLLASLERGDASHWPGGIYGRAFLREYAAAIGLPSEPIVAEFLRLFTKRGPEVSGHIDPPEGTGALRLTLASDPRWSGRTLATQAAAAAIDAGVVLGTGAALGTLFGVALWTPTAAFALAYYSLATTFLERSPVLWLIAAVGTRRAEARAKAHVHARPSSRDLLRIVPAPRAAQQPAEHDFPHTAENARIASR